MDIFISSHLTTKQRLNLDFKGNALENNVLKMMLCATLYLTLIRLLHNPLLTCHFVSAFY